MTGHYRERPDMAYMAYMAYMADCRAAENKFHVERRQSLATSSR